MRDFSCIKFNYTNGFILFSLSTLTKFRFDLPRSIRSKNPTQTKIIHTIFQFTEYVQHKVLLQMQQQIR